MLSVELDAEAERYLAEILACEKIGSSELIKRLLREQWHALQPQRTVLERMGGYPEQLLDGAPDLSDRDVRRSAIARQLQQHYEHQQTPDP